MSEFNRRNWQAFLRRLLTALGEMDEDGHLLSDAPQPPSTANSRISWEDDVPASGSRFEAQVQQAGKAKKDPGVRDTGRVDWGEAAAFSPGSLVGVEDAYEHTPLQAGERVAFCKHDKVAYHLSTWQFLKEYNQGRCCSCGRADQITLIKLPGAPAGPVAIPTAQPDLARGMPIIGLTEIGEHIGRAVVVQDYVYEVHRSQKGTYFVKFQPRSQAPRPFDGFKVVIFPNLVKIWERAGVDPQQYAGRVVQVRGVIAENPTWGIEIIASSPRMMRIVEDEQKSEAEA